MIINDSPDSVDCYIVYQNTSRHDYVGGLDDLVEEVEAPTVFINNIEPRSKFIEMQRDDS